MACIDDIDPGIGRGLRVPACEDITVVNASHPPGTPSIHGNRRGIRLHPSPCNDILTENHPLDDSRYNKINWCARRLTPTPDARHYPQRQATPRRC